MSNIGSYIGYRNGKRGCYVEYGGGWILSLTRDSDGDYEVEATNDEQLDWYFVGTLAHAGVGWIALRDDGRDSGLGRWEDKQLLACKLFDLLLEREGRSLAEQSL